jgi:hypothetical protein
VQPRIGVRSPSRHAALACLDAIAHPEGGAITIRANGQRGTRPVGAREAALKDQCFAVEVRDELLVLDLDCHTHPPGVVSRYVEIFADLACTHQIPYVVADSGTGWHVYLVIGDVNPNLRRRLAAAARLVHGSVDVRSGPSQYIRPLYVRHRSAIDPDSQQPRRSRPIDLTVDQALERLTGPYPPQESVVSLLDCLGEYAPVSAGPPSLYGARKEGLNPKTGRTLSGSAPEVGERSEVAFAVACDAAAAGRSRSEFVDLIEGTWVDDYHRSKQRGNIKKRLHSEFRRAQNSVGRHTGPAQAGSDGQDELRRAARELRHDLLSCPGIDARWWREGGHSLFDAILELVQQTGDTNLHLSVRRAALLAGMSRSAAHRQLRELETAGLISCTEPENRNQGTQVQPLLLQARHRLGLSDAPAADPVPFTDTRQPCSLGGELARCPTSLQMAASRSADIWTARGLGHSAWRLWAASAEGPPSAVLGYSEPWQAELSRRLRAVGLLDSEGAAVVVRSQLVTAAETLGVAGVVALRARLYADEQECFSETTDQEGVFLRQKRRPRWRTG